MSSLCEFEAISRSLSDGFAVQRTALYVLQCSDTVVVFSKRIEPAWKSDIKSESFL
jgi:hypothetical protein